MDGSLINTDENRLGSRWYYRPLEEGDTNRALVLFERSFGSKMSRALWRWKYEQPQAGGLVAVENDALIAYYGGIPRNLCFHGKSVYGIQISDTMVEPSKRGIMTKNGIFATTAKAFMHSSTGRGNMFGFGFGFPADRHTRLGEKLGLYRRVDSLDELSWQSVASVDGFWSFEELMADSVLLHANKLWTKMRAATQDFIVGEKSDAFIRHRYIKHPEHRYRFFGFRRPWGRRPLGIIIVRYHKEHDCIETLDMLGDPKDFRIGIDLLRFHAYKDRLKRVFIWATPAVAGFLPKPDSKHEVCNVCITTYKTEAYVPLVSDSWFATGGESDFR